MLVAAWLTTLLVQVNATPGPGRYVMPAIRDHRGGLFSK